ncbi:MAG: hypothetical protein LBH18_01955, partial [Spirochaetaceae bacterium]|nr:hypothetical protein [Spirochaetaceae bacterium]
DTSGRVLPAQGLIISRTSSYTILVSPLQRITQLDLRDYTARWFYEMIIICANTFIKLLSIAKKVKTMKDDG